MNEKEYYANKTDDDFIDEIKNKFKKEVWRLLQSGAIDTESDLPISSLHFVAMENVMMGYRYQEDVIRNLRRF